MDVRLFQTLGQTGAAILAMGGLAFAPPASGRMLLVPLSPSAVAMLPAAAVDGGARLLGKGPLAGSLVVEADRDRLNGVSLTSGVVVLAAPATLCGGATDGGAA